MTSQSNSMHATARCCLAPGAVCICASTSTRPVLSNSRMLCNLWPRPFAPGEEGPHIANASDGLRETRKCESTGCAVTTASEPSARLPVNPDAIASSKVATVPNNQPSPPAHQEPGREAESPLDIPARGWKDIIWRAAQDFSNKHLTLVAGGVTYYIILALFPGLAALVSIYGLVSNPAQVEQQVNSLRGILPASSQQLIGGELHQLVSSSSDALGVGVVVGILIALWSASNGMSGIITALDIAYDQPERRSFLRYYLLSLVLTLGLIVGGIILVAFVAGLPAVLAAMGASSGTQLLALIVEWPVLIIFVLIMLALLYRYAPDRDQPQWQWVSPGAIAATLIWTVTSILFTIYVSNFGSYNKTYGSLSAIIVLLTWLWISTSAVLFGAEINAESERQTRRDTTVGAPEPMGQRGAVAADTLGQSVDRQ
jgi:membrane protein